VEHAEVTPTTENTVLMNVVENCGPSTYIIDRKVYDTDRQKELENIEC